ncbi:MAG: hypothetical protein ACRD29_13070 [Acidimicrobiales bacterium]
MPGDDKHIESLERRIRALEAYSDESSWSAGSVTLAVCLGVVGFSLLLPWLRGASEFDDSHLGPRELVRGFELTPADSSILPDSVATIGAVVFWFLVLVFIPAVAYAVRHSAVFAVVAGGVQAVLLGWLAWAGWLDRSDLDIPVGTPGTGLLLCLVTVVVATLLAFGRWRNL